MTSSVIEGGSEKAKRESSDLVTESVNLTAANLSLPDETFLRAANSLKEKVLLLFFLFFFSVYTEGSRSC